MDRSDISEKNLPELIFSGVFVPPDIPLCPLLKLHINVN